MSRSHRKQRSTTLRYIMNRMQQRTSGTASASLILNFCNNFFTHLEKDVVNEGWGNAEVAASRRYLMSLLMSDGSQPDDTPARVAEIVRWRFAVGCAWTDVHKNCFPGQAQPWYPRLVTTARRFLEGPVSTPIQLQRNKNACMRA